MPPLSVSGDGSSDLPVNDGPRLRAAIRTPRSAAIAGVIFSLIFGVVIYLVQSSVPPDLTDPGSWITSSRLRSRVGLAIDLLPFAGIAFLWFIGVIRDRLGSREDRFFATVFLGSGLLFIAMIFASGAVLASLLFAAGSKPLSPELWRFGRYLSYDFMSNYALRMAAVFVIATSTLAGRLGLVPKWMMVAGYAAAFLLLFTVNVIPRIELLFPMWVFVVSIHIFLASFRSDRANSAG